MLADEFYESRSVGLPVRGKALKMLEDGVDAGLLKKHDRVFGIFVEVGVEYSLVHEVRVAADVEENPSQVMKPERRENERLTRYRVLDGFPQARIASSRPGLIFAIIVKP
jgi:hypothetical protein